MLTTRTPLAAFALILTLKLGAAWAGQDAPPMYLDPDKPVAQRVDDLIGRMTLEEKASQMVNGATAIPRLGVPHITGGAKRCTASW